MHDVGSPQLRGPFQGVAYNEDLGSTLVRPQFLEAAM